MSEKIIPLEKLGNIETVKVYNQAYIDKQQKRIEELEKEAEEYLAGEDYFDGFIIMPSAVSEAYIKGAEPREKRIAELEKENTELKKEVEKHKWNDIFLEDCADYDKKIAEEYTTLQEHIERLEKENTELKAKNKWYSEQVCNKECAEVWKQLTKAKEFLRMVIDSYHHEERFSFEKDLMKAEQFLKEVEND